MIKYVTGNNQSIIFQYFCRLPLTIQARQLEIVRYKTRLNNSHPHQTNHRESRLNEGKAIIGWFYRNSKWFHWAVSKHDPYSWHAWSPVVLACVEYRYYYVVLKTERLKQSTLQTNAIPTYFSPVITFFASIPDSLALWSHGTCFPASPITNCGLY